MPKNKELSVADFLRNGSLHGAQMKNKQWTGNDYFVTVRFGLIMKNSISFKFFGNVDVNTGKDSTVIDEPELPPLLDNEIFSFFVDLKPRTNRFEVTFYGLKKGIRVSCDEIAIINATGYIFEDNAEYIKKQEEAKKNIQKQKTEKRIENCISEFTQELYSSNGKQSVYDELIAPIARSQSALGLVVIGYLYNIHNDMNIVPAQLQQTINSRLKRKRLPQISNETWKMMMDALTPFENKDDYWENYLAGFEDNYLALSLLLTSFGYCSQQSSGRHSLDEKNWLRERSKVYRMYVFARRKFLDEHQNDKYRPFEF